MSVFFDNFVLWQRVLAAKLCPGVLLSVNFELRHCHITVTSRQIVNLGVAQKLTPYAVQLIWV